MASPLHFHFDYLSPYAYLAWKHVHDLARKHGRAVDPVPTLLAALLSAHGSKGPAEIEPKRIYTGKHVLRLAADVGVPLAPPPVHPFNPLLPLRITCSVLDADLRKQVIDALFDAAWGSGRGIHDETLVALALRDAGLDASALIAAGKRDENKAALKASTDAALAAGAFGVPTLFVDGELFFGFDSFGHVDRFLAGRDPVDAAQVARWTEAIKLGVRRV